MTKDEAGKLLSCSVDTIDRMCKQGKLNAKRFGRKQYIITKSILDALCGGPSICDGLTDLTSDDLAIRQKLRKG